MRLSLGTRVGPYEILSRLGAGGMGEVYRANDTRLDRTVAIKVLTGNVDRRRLEQEARTISGLNHPHICALFDIGREDDTDYLVMEYLDGETLASRLKKGAIPVERALQFAGEIAEALDEAHRRGVIHRDLKPGNVMLVKSGSRVVAKLLDFGLAKMVGKKPTVGDATQTVALTGAGAILGTPKYMAPEQFAGEQADARSDIYAFGLILSEMLRGKEAAPVAAEIAKRCLAEHPDDRWQSARDLQGALELARVAVPQPVIVKRGSRPAWVAAGVALAAVLTTLLWPRRTVAREPVTFSFGAPDNVTLEQWPGVPSPDGRRIAFVAQDESSTTALWIRPLDVQTAHRIQGTEGASGPFWSPDGRFLGFFAQGKLKKIAVAGGPAQNICNIQADLGATWNASGDIVLAPWNRTTLHRVSAAGGIPQPITALDDGRQENSHRWPHFLPDGRHFLFTARSSVKENTAVYVGSLDSRATKRLLTAQSNAQYAPPGYLLFGREGILMAQRFDARKMELAGELFPIVGAIAHVTSSASAIFAISADGSVLSHQDVARATLNRIEWFDRAGRSSGLVGSPGEYVEPRLSPDGKRLAFVIQDKESGNRDIWIMELSSGALTRFTFNPANDWHPVWSPDGKQIAFASDRKAKSSIYRKSLAGSGEEELLLPPGEGGVYTRDWSRDGRFLLYGTDTVKTLNDIWILPLFGDRKPIPFATSDFAEQLARFSPDGKTIAYTSNESGNSEVYVRAFERPEKLRISSNGGTQPVWRGDGRELFYLGPGGVLMAAELKAGVALEASAPKILFRTCTGSHSLRGGEEYYDAAADGSRFLVSCEVPGGTKQREITVSIDWLSKFQAHQ